jgi:hypothetical protein
MKSNARDIMYLNLLIKLVIRKSEFEDCPAKFTFVRAMSQRTQVRWHVALCLRVGGGYRRLNKAIVFCL